MEDPTYVDPVEAPPLFPERPDFHPRCDDCAALERQWDEAAGDPSAAVDVRVLFNRHCRGDRRAS